VTERSRERSSVTVIIAGEEHTIRARAEPEYTRACARFVDERIAEIRKRSGPIEPHKAAILAALSITDEFFRVRDTLDDRRERTLATVTELADEIDWRLTASQAEDDGNRGGDGTDDAASSGESRAAAGGEAASGEADQGASNEGRR